MNARKDDAWSPYLAGALSGVVLVLSVWIAGKFFGASTSFVRSAGLIEKLFSPERAHRGLGAIVGNILDDGKPGSAVGAVGKSVAVTAVSA